MSPLTKKFDDQARRLTGWPDCRCETAIPVGRTYDCTTMLIWEHFDGPATLAKCYPWNKKCKHRRLTLALIQAYRKGRNH